jgi:hypothetical protein
MLHSQPACHCRTDNRQDDIGQPNNTLTALHIGLDHCRSSLISVIWCPNWPEPHQTASLKSSQRTLLLLLVDHSFESADHIFTDANMYSTLLHSIYVGVHHSKVSDRRGSRCSHSGTKGGCSPKRSRHWSSVEDDKHNAQYVGQVIEDRLPDSPNLYMSVLSLYSF